MKVKKPSFEHYLAIFVLISLIGSFVFVIFFFQQPITGKAVLGITTSYQENEILEGQLSLALKPGELIPKDSIISVDVGDNNYEYVLSDIVDLETTEGKFYAENAVLEGSGEGYGNQGTNNKNLPIDVSFIIRIFQSSDEETSGSDSAEEQELTEETSEESETLEETIEEEQETAEETPEEEIVEEEDEKEKKEKKEKQSGLAPITGGVIAEISEEITGSTNINEPFTYELQEGQTAEVISSEQDVELIIEGNTIIVTTDYVGGENGFGEEYLGDDASYELVIDVSDLDIMAEEGEMKISLQYQDVEIISVSTTLNVESPQESNESVVLTPNITVILEDIEDYALTEEELFTLQTKTGDSTVQISKAEVINNRLIIRFEIGDYWLENSYSYSEGDDLRGQIALDQAKWLKRLSNSILVQEPSLVIVSDLLGESNLIPSSSTSSESTNESVN